MVRVNERSLMGCLHFYLRGKRLLYLVESCFDCYSKLWHSTSWLSKSRLMNMTVITVIQLTISGFLREAWSITVQSIFNKDPGP